MPMQVNGILTTNTVQIETLQVEVTENLEQFYIAV